MAYTPISQTISAWPASPDSANDTPSVFNTKANAWTAHQANVYQGEITTWTTQANLLASDINNTVASLPASVVNDATPSATNTYSSNKLETMTGSTPSSGWAGTTIADQAALRNFYGDQNITVQGGSFSAKAYPDGSVVGSTDNGSFEMFANGTMTQIGFVDEGDEPTADSAAAGGFRTSLSNSHSLPVLFINANYAITTTASSSTRLLPLLPSLLTESSIRINGWSTLAETQPYSYNYTATGRWK